jgi:uncharacterized protein (TIGR00369 family)
VAVVQILAIPEGFQPFDHPEGHIGLNGPYYFKNLSDGEFSYGFQTDERHGNPNGVIHGGALFSFVDTLLGHLIVSRTNRYCATVSITTEFVAAAPTGGWVEGTAELKKLTRSMAFVRAEVFCDGEILLLANSVFKLFGERDAF